MLKYDLVVRHEYLLVNREGKMGYEIGRVLYTEEQLRTKVEELAEQIHRDYKGQTVILVCVLTGAVTFFTDLARAIGPEVDVRFDFLSISSYGSSIVTTGTVRIQKDLSKDIRDMNVIIVEDIIDSGLSLSYIKDLLLPRQPKSLELCVMFDKKERRQKDIYVKYSGFAVPDEFIIGYGIDVASRYRHLQDLCVAVAED